MSNINDKAVATEDTNAKNITEELDMSKVISGTAVEVELTEEQLAEQKANDKIEQKFGVEALAARNSIRDIVNKLGQAENQLVLNTCSLGYTLVNIYKGFSVELKKHFWNIVDTSTRSKKTFERAIELVIEKGIKLPEAMDTTGGEIDIVENEKLLILDTKVLKLYEDSFAKVNKPTITKINNMKGLSNSDWDLVCSGSDKPYNAHMKEQNGIEQEKEKNKLLEKKPASMSEETYLGYCRDNAASIVAIDEKNKKISYLEKELEFFKNLVANNGLLPKQDSEELSDITIEKNLYSKSLNEEK